jgi:tRNA dimethylallyltransferase
VKAVSDSYFRPKFPVLVITGPTASGKTDTALLVGEALDGEIVSADSMQIYRGMDIGTAKATLDDRQRVSHHLLDIRDPGDRYSVADFKRDATTAISEIYDRGRRPILCGGTGQYLRAMIDGLVFTEVPTDLDMRRQLNQEAESLGLDSLLERLRQVDPESAGRLSPGDQKRIVRALEVFLQTGQTIGQLNLKSHQEGPDFSFQSYCLSHDRPILYERINRRVEAMMTAGLAQEVQNLLTFGLPDDATCLQAIGYKEMMPFMRGEISLTETVTCIQQSTRQYAKRQLTWFRGMAGLIWLINQSAAECAEIILRNH